MSWRPLPRPGTDPSPPRALADSFRSVAERIGGPGGAHLVTLASSWADIVGAAVANHSRPVRLDRGTLTVAVDQPGWATELTYQQAAMRKRIDEVVGDAAVSELRVVVRPTGNWRRGPERS